MRGFVIRFLGLTWATTCVACSQVAPPDAACPNPVAWSDAAQHLGQFVRVRGPIHAIRYAPTADGQPTFLDIGAGYPDPARFTVVIWGRDRPNFPGPPEQIYAGRAVCVQGVIEADLGTPGLEVARPASVIVE